LIRLEQLIQEANVPPQPALIAAAVDLIVVIVRRPSGRVVTEVARLRGPSPFGYVLDYIEPAAETLSAHSRRVLSVA
jgi:Flp pilus assembly CpaF family ATPase